MRIDLKARRVELSAQEFATFRPGPGAGAGGEAGPVRSAGLLIVTDVAWPAADLRVDWAEDPIGELARLWQRWAPEMEAYVTRALDPQTAPAYGVPGDP